MIQLTILSDQDAEPLFNLIEKNRNHLQAWFPWVANTLRVEDSQKFISTINDRHWGIFWNDQLVGVIGIPSIESINNNLQCELGFWIDHDHEGQGIIKRACNALIEKIFTESEIKTILIKTTKDNKRCMALLKRLEFVENLENNAEVKQFIMHYSDWLNQLNLQCSTMLPTLDEDLILRTNEPIGYSKRLGNLYHFTSDGQEILKLVDGKKTLAEIINTLNADDDENALLSYKAVKFINKCCDAQLVRLL